MKDFYYMEDNKFIVPLKPDSPENQLIELFNKLRAFFGQHGFKVVEDKE